MHGERNPLRAQGKFQCLGAFFQGRGSDSVDEVVDDRPVDPPDATVGVETLVVRRAFQRALAPLCPPAG